MNNYSWEFNQLEQRRDGKKSPLKSNYWKKCLKFGILKYFNISMFEK